MTLKIHTFQISSPKGAADLTEGLAPMKAEYDNEYLAKLPDIHREVTYDMALEKILEEVRESYHFLIAKKGGEYAGYTAGYMPPSGWFESMATFVKPDFRRSGIGKELKTQQLNYARNDLGEGFTTTIDRVNTEAYEMMKKMGAKFETTGTGDAYTGWRVYIDF